MELCQQILVGLLRKEDISVTFPNLTLSATELLESKCYCALKEIQGIIRDDSLTDTECFEQIERIVCVFEQMGSGGGCRHDF